MDKTQRSNSNWAAQPAKKGVQVLLNGGERREERWKD